MPPAENKPPKSESAPYMQPAWPTWLKTWQWLAGITVLVLALGSLLPALHVTKQPFERLLLRDLSSHVKSYSWEHNGLWPTNWAQVTNTVFRSSPRLYNQSLFLPDHYVFIPHDQIWEITPHNSRAPLRLVMLRSSPKSDKGKSNPGRYAIAFYPSDNPARREFEVEWFRESEVTNLLTQSAYSLPPLQKHDS